MRYAIKVLGNRFKLLLKKYDVILKRSFESEDVFITILEIVFPNTAFFRGFLKTKNNCLRKTRFNLLRKAYQNILLIFNPMNK